MNLLVFSGLSDHKLKSKLAPLASLDGVEKIYLARNKPLPYSKVSAFRASFLLSIPIVREKLKLLYGIWIALFRDVDYIIGIYMIPHGVLAHVVGRLCRVPVIQLVIGDDADTIINHPRLFKRILIKAAKIGVRGTRSLDRLNQMVGRSSSFFIHHNVYTFPKIEEKSPGKEIDLINIGHFEFYKRIDILIEVVSRLKETYPRITAVMAGKDIAHRKQKYTRYAVERGLENNIQFAGYIEDVHALLKRSKIFILTSEREGLPMAMIEAMSFGIPCVVPDVGDIKDIAEHGSNALVVDPLDVEGFVASVRRLLEESVLYESLCRNGIATIEKLKDEFSLQRIKKTWEDILD